jgi:hypothetical protein
LEDGDPVAITIDSNDWPYQVLSIRGSAEVELIDGVVPEYAAAARRYFGEQQGKAWVDQFPPGTQMWRIAVTPAWANILDFETRFPSALSAA